jgi:superfamily I DNA/RNA helicase
LRSIGGITADGVTIKGSDRDYVAQHPLGQARDYTLNVVDALKRRPALRDGERLGCAWGYGVVLPSLTTADIGTPSLSGPTLEEALGTGLVLTADDLSAPGLLPRLRRLLPPWSAGTPRLTPAQVDEIRAVLYPEIRIGWAMSDQEIVEVMDRQQERLARSLGDGHRLLRGVAGSGKTITLTCRARHLRAVHPTWRILAVCFNTVLAEFLRRAIGIDDRITVSTFHAWCAGELRRAGIALPPKPARGRPWHDYWERVPRLLLDAYATGRAPTATYQAILVDEGQDFAADWYRALLIVLDPAANSLFIALDSSQNIYRRKTSWRELGVHVQGRSQVLRTNYRNTRQILDAAYGIIRQLDARAARSAGQGEEYVVPERCVRDGPRPEIHRYDSSDDARHFALQWIRARLARNVSPDDILVLGPGRLQIESLVQWLTDSGVPAVWVAAHVPSGAVRLSTIHSAKGLDAGHVLLVGGHELEQRGNEEGRRLLYIAMTRARNELCVSYQGESQLIAEIDTTISHGP